MGYFLGPLGNFFQESWASFWTPRQLFSRVMGFFFGPLGKTFLESWASFLDAVEQILRSQPDPSPNAPKDQIRRKEPLLRLANPKVRTS